jgi:hypothetical protein
MKARRWKRPPVEYRRPRVRDLAQAVSYGYAWHTHSQVMAVLVIALTILITRCVRRVPRD